MSVFIVLLALSATVITVSAGAPNYCNVKCRWPPAVHTMCQYPDGGSADCSHIDRWLTDEERTIILDLHNEMRQRVALGMEKRGWQPPASNMRELEWDPELEIIAQRWADQCVTVAHDVCRSTLDGTACGQNVFYGHHVSKKTFVIEAVKSFYNEVEHFDKRFITSFNHQAVFSVKAGHYTQLVWAETSKIGCGYVRNPDTQPGFPVRLVCNYKKAGNFEQQPVYLTGKPCSACPSDAPNCSDKWKGLCSANYRGWNLMSNS